ncbi:T9SS type A sorting domain-containing protein [Flavobacterium jejuense]|uniref:T9SS type A sorting domain-containing protein n=1 Tax=Flavobacterium jejuense TaxID=1544455 RepID=A0ABX0IKY1_9FLAO|nr:T9SS type A sorting domain-containing protein [Flavobacterium jejuense]NHN24472.1 T9SS type A sorting domain-containing protein [Flavobacterium jejuense]
MMKKIYLLLLVLLGLNLQAQIVNIPDANFKAKLLSASSSNQIASTQTPNTFNGSVSMYHKIDTNEDGEIQVSEALTIKYLNVSSSNISSITGLEAFTNILYLNATNNQLSNVNFSSNLNLKFIQLSNNIITNIDCSQNLNLNTINLFSNQLLTIDVSNLSSLKTLDLSFNQLTTIDISSNQNLESFSVGNNNLTSINLSNNSNLTLLRIYSNQISTIDLSILTNLNWLELDSNQLTSIDLSNNTNLTYIQLGGNQLSTIDVSMLSNLDFLNIPQNFLTSINLTNNINLSQLSIAKNQLTELDVSNNTNLFILNCYDNLISSLDISSLTGLKFLYFEKNQITNIDVSNNSLLETLACNNNQLTIIDITNNPFLRSLKCKDNPLLESLFIKNGNLNTWSNLDFSNNSNLEYICADEGDLALVQQKITDYNYSNCHVNSYCSFTPNGTSFSISGKIKYDFNSNGCDLADLNYTNLKFSIVNGTNSGSLISNQTGNYNIPVQAGSHTITPNLENPTYFNISPTSFTVNFPTQASPFTQDFCVTANGVHSDVEVVVLPTVSARPGFDAKYKISYRNKGNQVENGSVSLTFEDTVLDYLSSNPVFNSQATNSYTWNYTNLQPFETREIEIVFNVNSPTETPTVNIDDVLNYTATISTSNTDETPNDNTFTLNQTVVGSYDPNDKTCLEGEIVSPDMIGEYVHYLIRFENTGTYPAENVVVKDMIDLTKFDIATLIPLKGSHDFYTRIKDNKVEFIFENINLDFNDATNDGYVAFKIKTKPTLVVGDTFSNDANIYFDYNFPITTNTYTTTIQALSSQDFDFVSQFTLYPNPVKDVLHFNSKENLEIQSVEIYNMLGQIVISVPNASKSIDVSSLTNGDYFVKVNTEKGSATTKLIKE